MILLINGTLSLQAIISPMCMRGGVSWRLYHVHERGSEVQDIREELKLSLLVLNLMILDGETED